MLLFNDKEKVVKEHRYNFLCVREKCSVNWFSHVVLFWRERRPVMPLSCHAYFLSTTLQESCNNEESCNNATPAMDRGFV